MKKESLLGALIKSAGLILLFYAMMNLASTLGKLVILSCLNLKGVPDAELPVLLQTLSYKYNYEIMLLFALLTLAVMTVLYARRWREATGFCKLRPMGVASCLLLGFGSFLAALLLIQFAAALPAFTESRDSYMENEMILQLAEGNLWTELLYVAFLCPVLEELLFRGLILRKLCRVMPSVAAIGLTGVAFALVHGNLYQLVFTLPLGLFLGFLAHRFGSLWASILVHAAFNFCNYPLRIAAYFGVSMESDTAMLIALALYLFCGLCLLTGLVLLRAALPQAKEMPRPLTPSHQTTTQTNEGDAMAAPEFLIVGLGNPGDKYAATRHNCGFMAVDYIALRENVSVKNARFHALVGEITLQGKKGLLMKPTTFMNLSGDAVREAAAFYHIPPRRVLVLYDDINFRPGLLRIRKDGSAGGHNGIKSILANLGSADFPRVKIGIGAPAPGMELMHHVLGKLSEEEQDAVLSVMEDVYDTARRFVADDLDSAMARYNGKK